VVEPSSQEEPEFTIIDKRRAHQPGEEGDTSEAPTVSSPPRAEAPRPDPQDSTAPSSALTPDLSALFLMLGTSALMHLGQAPDPVTGQSSRDLAQAQYAIDMLGLLKEKTEGHRSPDESQLLDELLYDLRMRYVQTSRRG